MCMSSTIYSKWAFFIYVSLVALITPLDIFSSSSDILITALSVCDVIVTSPIEIVRIFILLFNFTGLCLMEIGVMNKKKLYLSLYDPSMYRVYNVNTLARRRSYGVVGV